jgi:hypothetical protein
LPTCHRSARLSLDGTCPSVSSRLSAQRVIPAFAVEARGIDDHRSGATDDVRAFHPRFLCRGLALVRTEENPSDTHV